MKNLMIARTLFLALILSSFSLGLYASTSSDLDRAEALNEQITVINHQATSILNNCQANGDYGVNDDQQLTQMQGMLAQMSDELRSLTQRIGGQALNRDANRLHGKVNSLAGKLNSLANARPGSQRLMQAIDQALNDLRSIQAESDCIRVEIQTIRNSAK